MGDVIHVGIGREFEEKFDGGQGDAGLMQVPYSTVSVQFAQVCTSCDTHVSITQDSY